MAEITCHFDFISPYAHLALAALPEALEGLDCTVRYRPVLFAGLLKEHGQLGPAEIPSKRDWTYRQVLWLADRHGIALRLPRHHPFNPLPLLRLAVASAESGEPSRAVCETIFRHAWSSGQDAVDPQRVAELASTLPRVHDPEGPWVKERLREFTREAIEAGLFGVPSFVVDGRVFWGFDSLPMLRAFLTGDRWFAEGDWEQAARVGAGVVRGR